MRLGWRRPLFAAAVATATTATTASAAAPAPPDEIRTRGPSRPTDAKVAIVATARQMTGKRFRVVDTASGRAVLSGQLRRAAGVRAPWRNATTADLSTIATPGSYRITVGRLRSRPWVVDET